MLRSAAAPNQETTPTRMQQRQLNQLLSSQLLPRWRNALLASAARQNARVGGIKRPLDPLPRLIAIPGLGLIGVGVAQ